MVFSTPQTKTSNPTVNKKEGQKQPFFNVVVFLFSLLGVGSMVGCTIIFFIFHEKCTEVLLARDSSHNSTQGKLEKKYFTALSDVRRCQEDSEARENRKELEGRLQAQSALSDRHQDLLARHERTLEKISDLQLKSEGSQAQIRVFKEEIRLSQMLFEESSEQLREAQSERDDIQRKLQGQIAYTSIVLKKLEQKTIELRAVLDSCDEKVKNAQGKFAELRDFVQQQNYASVIAMFGEGPYIVRFNLEFPYEPVEPNYFEVKIFNTRDMPHTVLTFLNMVDNGLYVDTTIDFAKDRIIKGGSLASVEPQLGKNMKSTVLRRFANFGYSAHNPLFFEDESSHNAPCRHSSFSLYERGPGFMIYLTNELENAPNNCPGVIISGRDTLDRIIRAHTNTPNGGALTWKVPIVATYLVSLEDEL